MVPRPIALVAVLRFTAPGDILRAMSVCPLVAEEGAASLATASEHPMLNEISLRSSGTMLSHISFSYA